MEGAGRGSRETPEHPLHPPLSLFEMQLFVCMKVPFQYQFFVLSDGRVSIIDTQMEALNFILLLLQLLYMTGKYVCCAYIRHLSVCQLQMPVPSCLCAYFHACAVIVCLSFCTLSNIQRHRNVQKGSKMEIQIPRMLIANSTI